MMSDEELSGRLVYGLLIIAIAIILIAAIIKYVDETISQAALAGGVVVIAYVSYLLFGSEKGPRKRAKPAARPKKKTPKKVEPTKAKPEPKAKAKPDEHAEEHVPRVVIPAAKLEDLPIESIEGIGTVYGRELRSAGIHTVEDLIGTPATKIAKICDVGPEMAKRWIAMGRFAWLDTVSEEDAEAIVFATGITDVKSLARADPTELLEKIKNAVKSGDVRVPAGYRFSLDRVQSWIAEAKRRTR